MNNQQKNIQLAFPDPDQSGYIQQPMPGKIVKSKLSDTTLALAGKVMGGNFLTQSETDEKLAELETANTRSPT